MHVVWQPGEVDVLAAEACDGRDDRDAHRGAGLADLAKQVGGGLAGGQELRRAQQVEELRRAGGLVGVAGWRGLKEQGMDGREGRARLLRGVRARGRALLVSTGASPQARSPAYHLLQLHSQQHAVPSYGIRHIARPCLPAAPLSHELTTDLRIIFNTKKTAPHTLSTSRLASATMGKLATWRMYTAGASITARLSCWRSAGLLASAANIWVVPCMGCGVPTTYHGLIGRPRPTE